MENIDTGTAPVETPAATEGLQSDPIFSETATPASEPAASPRDTMQAVWDKHNPTRAADGKFAGKEPVEPPLAASETTDQPIEKPIETAPAPSIEAPASWSADMKAKFGELSPEVREYITTRESDAHKAITQLGQRAKAFEPLAQTVGRHSDFIQRFGLAPEQAIDNLFTAARSLQENPGAFIQHIARTHGVDLQALAGVPTQDGQPSAHDPRVSQLEQQLAQVTSLLNAQQRQQLEARQKSIESEIETFAKDKAHWADLENDIVLEVQAIRAAEPHLSPAQVLEKAYERATWANPSTRERILADQRKADEDKRKAEQEKKAAEARKVAPLNQRSSRGASPVSPAAMRDSMASVAAKYGLR